MRRATEHQLRRAYTPACPWHTPLSWPRRRRHRRLSALGISPRTKDAAPSGGAFPFVVFAAPPSGSEDYMGEIKAALALWDGTGSFVFTSSAGVYTVEDGSGGCWVLRRDAGWPARAAAAAAAALCDSHRAGPRIPRPAACDESAPTAKLGDNERTDRLLAAEQAVLDAGGIVVRLVGLYHAQRYGGGL